MADRQAIALVGFGEVGQAFARGWALAPRTLCAYDVKIDNCEDWPVIRNAAEKLGVELRRTMAETLLDREVIFALVPTDQSGDAASAAAPYLKRGAIWLDGSSSSPGRKRDIAAMIEGAGGRYVDMAIMAPVYPRLHETPLLLSGAAAAEALDIVNSLGMVANLAGDAVGHASAIKMIRSVHIKGIEAVTAECLLAARRAGLDDAVLKSLAASDPGVDWASRGAYNLERMTRHGHRRAAEMREVVKTLDELGVPSRISSATAIWQDQLGDSGIEVRDQPLAQRLDTVLDALG